MTTIHHATGPGVRLAEALGADDSIRSTLAGDIHLVSLDGETFYLFPRSPQPEDHEVLQEIIEEDGSRLPVYTRGIVARAMGEIREISATLEP
jgi:hypothetical protein